MFPPLAFIEGIGTPELLTIMFIVLLLFGSNRLPELAKGLGKSMREFKKATSSVEAEVRRAMEEEPTPPAKRPAPPVSIQSTKPAAIQPGSSPDRSATPPPPPDIAD